MVTDIHSTGSSNEISANDFVIVQLTRLDLYCMLHTQTVAL